MLAAMGSRFHSFETAEVAPDELTGEQEGGCHQTGSI